VLIYLFL